MLLVGMGCMLFAFQADEVGAGRFDGAGKDQMVLTMVGVMLALAGLLAVIASPRDQQR